MLLRPASLAFAFALATAACGSSTEPESQSAAGLTDNVDIGFADCRIYIEKVSATAHAHHIQNIDFFLKTHVGFDSAIDKVFFHAAIKWTGDDRLDWADSEAKPYLGAEDFFTVSQFISPHNNSGRSIDYVRGVFYVRTVNGTNYWLKAPGGQDFILDQTLFDNLESTMKRTGMHGTYAPDYGREIFTSETPDDAMFTDGNFPYFNTNQCR
jgi:hypothetical protein